MHIFNNIYIESAFSPKIIKNGQKGSIKWPIGDMPKWPKSRIWTCSDLQIWRFHQMTTFGHFWTQSGTPKCVLLRVYPAYPWRPRVQNGVLKSDHLVLRVALRSEHLRSQISDVKISDLKIRSQISRSDITDSITQLSIPNVLALYSIY